MVMLEKCGGRVAGIGRQIRYRLRHLRVDLALPGRPDAKTNGRQQGVRALAGDADRV